MHDYVGLTQLAVQDELTIYEVMYCTLYYYYHIILLYLISIAEKGIQ